MEANVVRTLLVICFALFSNPLWSAEEAVAAPAPNAWADKVKVSGFLKTWFVAADNVKKDYRAGSALVKNMRVKIEAKPAEDWSVVVMPELAGSAGASLLDAYVAIKRGPVTLTGGQFTVPFGEDITGSPAKLWSVDNSMVFGLVRGGKNRDQGAMATVAMGPLKVQAAAIQGLGINPVAGANGYTTDRNDYVGRVEATVRKSMVAAAAVYSGTNTTSPVQNNWSEVSLKCNGSPLLPALFWKAEWLNNPVSTHWGITGNVGLKTGLYKTVLIYERFRDNLADAGGRTNFGGGVTRDMGNGLSLTLQSFGVSAGPSESPTGGRTVAQLLAEF
jgi:hypothetical protein